MAHPNAKKQPHKLKKHKHTRIDPYYWMRLNDMQKESKNPDLQTKSVLDYIKEEHVYFEANMQHTKPLQDEIFKEITGRLKQYDSSVPYLMRGYNYYTRYEKNQEYPIYARKKDCLDADEEVLLDVNELAQEQMYCCVTGLSVSPNNQWLIYGQDCKGNRVYTLFFKHIESQQTLTYTIPNCSGSVCWAQDSQHVFYVRLNPETLREESVYLHQCHLKTPQNYNPLDDTLIYNEPDESFSLNLSKSKSEMFIFIECDATLTSETLILDPFNPLKKPKPLIKRQHKHEYQLDHVNNYFYILSNLNAKNNILARFKRTDSKPKHWEIIVAHDPDVHLLDFEVFNQHIAIIQRKNGFKQLQILNTNTKISHLVNFDQAFYNIDLDINLQVNTRNLRINFSSFCTPDCLFDLNMTTFKKTLLKQEEVVGGYNQNNYVAKRLMAQAADGTPIPISLVYNKNLKQTKPQ